MIRTLRRRLAAGLAVLAVGTASAALATPGTASAASDTKLTIALATQVSTFNPFLAYFDGELDAINVTYPALVWGDAQSQPSPYLADKWTTSADKLTWTFDLHPGLKWSDGKPITAHDVAWTFNLIMTNKTAATANGQLVENFKSVTADGDDTVKITTKTPQANMLFVVGLPIVPQHIWESKVADLKNYKNTDFPVVGYGPWELTDYQTDQYATLKANKDFFLADARPHYDTLILQYFKDTDAAVAALKSGQVDQVDRLTATEFKPLENDSDLVTYQQIGSRWSGVEINPGAHTKKGKKLGTGNPILGDDTVRTAIAYGIDRETLVHKVLNDLGQVGAGYLPPAFPEFSWKPSAADTVGYDPDKANQLLDAAGYKKGSDGIRTDPDTGKKLSFRLGIHSDDPNDASISDYLVGWMKSIGIELTVESQSMTALNQNLAKGDWDMLMDGWGTGVDPTYLLGIQTCGVLPDEDGSGGNTDAFFCDKDYDKLYAQQQQEFDASKRQDMIKQMQQILYQANDDVILYYENDLAAVTKDSQAGFITGSKNSDGFYPFQNVIRSWSTAVPSASSSSDSSSNTGVVIGIVAVVVVIVLVGGGLALRRRSTAADRE